VAWTHGTRICKPIIEFRGRSPLKLKIYHILDAERKQQIRLMLRIQQTGESSSKPDRRQQKLTGFASVSGTTCGKSWLDTDIDKLFFFVFSMSAISTAF